MKRLLAAFGMVLLLAAGQASANIIFTFSGVTFSDGGTLSGTFTTNDAVNSLVDFDLLTSGGAAVGFHYTPGTANSLSSLPFVLVVEPASLDHILQVTFAGGLTPLGAAITIGTFDSFEQIGTDHRDITAGSAAPAPTVPEPGTLLLLGAGMIVIGMAALRRRHQRK
jgi:PEP-CTERM motif